LLLAVLEIDSPFVLVGFPLVFNFMFKQIYNIKFKLDIFKTKNPGILHTWIIEVSIN
jgi:hypothetical protein